MINLCSNIILAYNRWFLFSKFFCVFSFDTGKIVRQYKCEIFQNETTPDLRNRLADYGANLLMECIKDLPRCLKHAQPQEKKGATHGMNQFIFSYHTMSDLLYNLLIQCKRLIFFF